MQPDGAFCETMQKYFKPLKSGHKERHGTEGKAKSLIVNKHLIQNEVNTCFMKKEKTKLRNKQGPRLKEVVNNFNNKITKCATASQIQINEEFVDCLLDTGAYTSFISERYCIKRNFQMEIIQNRKNWVTANGIPIQTTGQVYLQVRFNDNRFMAPFIVAKELAQDVIIGVDILKPNRCIIDFDKNILICGKGTLDIVTMTPPRSAYAHANCNITINSYEQEIIWVNADRFCDTVHITSAGKSKVTESITTKQNNKIPVVIINPTNVPRTVRKGDIIATVSPVEIIAEIKNSADWDNFISQQPELIH